MPASVARKERDARAFEAPYDQQIGRDSERASGIKFAHMRSSSIA